MKRHGLYNDDWYNLGKLLALNYNKNWDDRGTKKGLALQDVMMNNPDPTDEDMGNAFAAERNKLMQKTSGLTGMIPQEYRINPGTNASDNSTTGGLTSMIPKEYQVKPAEATPATNSGLLSSMFPKPAEKQPQGLFTEFLQNQSDRANAVRVATTPDENKVRELAAQQAKIRNDENFNSEEYLARLNKALIQQGLSPESREAVMKQATAEAAAKQRGLYEQKSDGLLTEYNNLIKNGNYTDAFALLPQIAKYSQPAAQMLYGGGVTPKELYNYTENKKIRDEEHARRKEIMELYPRNVGGGGYRGNPGNSSGSIPNYVMQLDKLTEAAKIAMGSGDVEQIDKEINQIKLAVAMYSRIMPEQHKAEYLENIKELEKLRDMKAGNFGDSAGDKSRKEREGGGGGLFSSIGNLFSSKDDNSADSNGDTSKNSYIYTTLPNGREVKAEYIDLTPGLLSTISSWIDKVKTTRGGNYDPYYNRRSYP